MTRAEDWLQTSTKTPMSPHLSSRICCIWQIVAPGDQSPQLQPQSPFWRSSLVAARSARTGPRAARQCGFIPQRHEGGRGPFRAVDEDKGAADSLPGLTK